MDIRLIGYGIHEVETIQTYDCELLMLTMHEVDTKTAILEG